MSSTHEGQDPAQPPAESVPPAPRVKICGITSLQDAELSVELGAWAIGLNFYDASPRSCSLEQAGIICAALRRRVELCGVFVNAPLPRIVQVSEDLGLTLVQLHGDEGPSFCGEVARRTGARIIKAAQVSGSADIRDLERFHVDFHRAPLEGPVDPQWRPDRRERRTRRRADKPVRDRHRQRDRVRTGSQGPREAPRAL
jgi:phosphoribosylanthranilate isomerase